MDGTAATSSRRRSTCRPGPPTIFCTASGTRLTVERPNGSNGRGCSILPWLERRRCSSRTDDPRSPHLRRGQREEDVHRGRRTSRRPSSLGGPRFRRNRRTTRFHPRRSRAGRRRGTRSTRPDDDRTASRPEGGSRCRSTPADGRRTASRSAPRVERSAGRNRPSTYRTTTWLGTGLRRDTGDATTHAILLPSTATFSAAAAAGQPTSVSRSPVLQCQTTSRKSGNAVWPSRYSVPANAQHR